MRGSVATVAGSDSTTVLLLQRCLSMNGCVVAAVAKELVDERRAALGDGRHSDAQSDGVYLTYLLSNKNIGLDEVYSNVMEMLLAATDTVGACSCIVETIRSCCSLLCHN